MAIRAIRAFGDIGAAGAQQYECSHNIILCAQYPVIHTIYNYIISVCVCEPQAWTDPGHPVLQACRTIITTHMIASLMVRNTIKIIINLSCFGFQYFTSKCASTDQSV